MASLEYAYHLNINTQRWLQQFQREGTTTHQLQQGQQVLSATRAGHVIQPTYDDNFLQIRFHRKTRMIK